MVEGLFPTSLRVSLPLSAPIIRGKCLPLAQASHLATRSDRFREKSWIRGDHCNEGVEVDTKVINEGQARMSDTRVEKPKSVHGIEREYGWESLTAGRWSSYATCYVKEEK